jgi:hypothetical protein
LLELCGAPEPLDGFVEHDHLVALRRPLEKCNGGGSYDLQNALAMPLLCNAAVRPGATISIPIFFSKRRLSGIRN